MATQGKIDDHFHHYNMVHCILAEIIMDNFALISIISMESISGCSVLVVEEDFFSEISSFMNCCSEKYTGTKIGNTDTNRSAEGKSTNVGSAGGRIIDNVLFGQPADRTAF